MNKDKRYMLTFTFIVFIALMIINVFAFSFGEYSLQLFLWNVVGFAFISIVITVMIGLITQNDRK